MSRWEERPARDVSSRFAVWEAWCARRHRRREYERAQGLTPGNRAYAPVAYHVPSKQRPDGKTLETPRMKSNDEVLWLGHSRASRGRYTCASRRSAPSSPPGDLQVTSLFLSSLDGTVRIAPTRRWEYCYSKEHDLKYHRKERQMKNPKTAEKDRKWVETRSSEMVPYPQGFGFEEQWSTDDPHQSYRIQRDYAIGSHKQQ